MANEIFKELKTKIALKTLTFAEWEAIKDTYKPLRGEVCICEIPEGNAAATNAPTVLFKVGDGTNYFSGLKWASALAADVHSWAKAATKPEYQASEIKGLDEYIAGEIQDTNTDTQYSFDIVDGKLEVKKTLYTLGVARTPETVGTYDFVTPNELTTILASYYTKTEVDNLIQGVNNKIDGLDESVTTVAKGTGINVTDAGTGNDHAYTVALDVAGAKTALGLDAEGIAAYVTVESLNNTAAEYANDVKTGVENGTIKAKDAEHADAAGKVDAALTIKVGGSDVVFDGSAAKTADVDTAIAAAEKRAKDYADAKPHENTAHSHSAGSGTKVSANGGIDGDVKVNLNVAFELVDKTIKLYDKDDATKTAIATLDATEFIADGMLQSVVADEAKNELVFTWNTDAGVTPTTVPFDMIADIYTGSANSEISVAVSNTNEISATLVNKGVTEEKLEQDVQDALALARTALQSHQDISGKKDKQTAVADHNLSGATVVKGIAQDENGEITVSTRTLTPADIGAATKNEAKYAGSDNITVDADRKISLNSELKGITSINGSDIYITVGDGDTIGLSMEQDGLVNLKGRTLNLNFADGVDVNTFLAVQAGLQVTGDVTINNKTLETVIKTTKVNNATAADSATYDGANNNIAETYATKADALYEVEAGTGLKVSNKADNKQTINIDEAVVFVLNCNF